MNAPPAVWVQIITTQRVVEVGLRMILEWADAPFRITTAGPAGAEPDVVLFDVIKMRDGDTTELELWLKESAATVIAINRTLRPELGAAARAKGVEWAIDLGINEAELLQMIVHGAGNQEIADTMYVSINSVKTYIRSTYRKIGVENRTQAAVWGLQHGFTPPAKSGSSPVAPA
jgi:NarL family two-component system response regulator LiaR